MCVLVAHLQHLHCVFDAEAVWGLGGSGEELRYGTADGSQQLSVQTQLLEGGEDEALETMSGEATEIQNKLMDNTSC